jgi:hypothetical protein
MDNRKMRSNDTGKFNHVPKNKIKFAPNSTTTTTETNSPSTQLRPTVQKLFASVTLVQASA